MQKLQKQIREATTSFIEAFIISVAVVMFVFWFVGQPLEIEGDSMYPAYEDGEQIIAAKISVKLNGPQRGDVVIFRHPERNLAYAIKRVIGIPGDTFEIKEGGVYINGTKLEEPYTTDITEGKSYFAEGQTYDVPADKYILMGDNRDESLDSRIWGYIDIESIVGIPFVVYSPLSNFRIVQ